MAEKLFNAEKALVNYPKWLNMDLSKIKILVLTHFFEWDDMTWYELLTIGENSNTAEFMSNVVTIMTGGIDLIRIQFSDGEVSEYRGYIEKI